MKLTGPITERDLDIAETVLVRTLQASSLTYKVTGANPVQIERILLASDMRESLRQRLEEIVKENATGEPA